MVSHASYVLSKPSMFVQFAVFTALIIATVTASPLLDHSPDRTATPQFSIIFGNDGDTKVSQYAPRGGALHVDPETNLGTLNLYGVKPNDAGLSIWTTRSENATTESHQDAVDNRMIARVLDTQPQIALLTGWAKTASNNGGSITPIIDVRNSFLITLELLECFMDNSSAVQYNIRLGDTVLGTDANGTITAGLIGPGTGNSKFVFNIPTVLIMDVLHTNDTTALGYFQKYASLRYHEEEETQVLGSVYKRMTLRAKGELVESQGIRTCLLLILGGPIGCATCFIETLIGCIIGPITLFILCLWL